MNGWDDCVNWEKTLNLSSVVVSRWLMRGRRDCSCLGVAKVEYNKDSTLQKETLASS